MGKRVRKNKKIFIILECSIIVLCFLFLYGSYKLYKSTNKNKEIISDYHNKYKSLSSSYNDLIVVSKDLDIKNNRYKDIDKSINDLKSDYFKNIKKLEDDILSGKSDRKIAYITFDDGPYYNTHKVLDILDQNDVKATFFTISMNGEFCFDNKSENCYSMYKEYYKRGHTIANHTYTHAIRGGLYNSVNSFMDAIIRQENHINNMTNGYITNITRFPGGSAQAKDLKNPIIDSLRERGYGWVDWTAYDGDGKALYSTDQAWENLHKTIDDKIEVILFHDYNRITTEILPDVINYLRDNGYEMYPLFYESNMINK